MSITDPRALTDEALIQAIAKHHGGERQAMAAVIGHLAEFEARELHLALGFRSLYGYCRRVLHLAEHEAYNRMEVARLARRFPVVVAMLEEGRVHLTALRLLAPHLGDENHLALLGGAVHCSKDEVRELIARWFPRPAVATSIRAAPVRMANGATMGEKQGTALPEPRSGAVSAVAPVPAESRAAADGEAPALGTTSTPSHTGDSSQVRTDSLGLLNARAAIRRETRPATFEPLSSDTFLVRVTARRRTIDRLRRAQELLSHAVPGGDVDEILYRALDEFVSRREADPPVTDRGSARKVKETPPDSRDVARAVERAVRRRDGPRCTFVGKDRRRCEERRFLELHHIRPWAAGGPPTVENLALLCRAHNQYEARRYFGPIAAARAGERLPVAEVPAGSGDRFSKGRAPASSFRNEPGPAPPS
jgi:hypothetical protein